MADCASLLDEELSSFVFNYLTENSRSQYGEEEVSSDRLDVDFSDIDLSQLDASDFDSVNCLSELHWCNDQSDSSPASIPYSTGDPFEIEEENAALLAALTDSLDGMVEDEVGGLSVFPSLGEGLEDEDEEEEEEEEEDLPLGKEPFPETEDPSLLRKLLLSPVNMPVGFEAQKEGITHRHSNRNLHLKPQRLLSKCDATKDRKPRVVRPVGRLCTELHRHLTTPQEAESTNEESESELEEEEEEEEEEDEEEEEESASEEESSTSSEPAESQFASEKELRSVVDLIKYMHTYCLPARKQSGWDRKERQSQGLARRARSECPPARPAPACHRATPQGGSGARPRAAFMRRREVKGHSLLRELLETVDSFDVSKPYRLQSPPYSHSRGTSIKLAQDKKAEPPMTPAHPTKTEHKDSTSKGPENESALGSAPDAKGPKLAMRCEPEEASFSVRRSRRLASFPGRFAKRVRVGKGRARVEPVSGQHCEEAVPAKQSSSDLAANSCKTNTQKMVITESPCSQNEKRSCLCLPLTPKSTGDGQFVNKAFEPPIAVELCGTAGLTPPTTPPHKPAEDEPFKPDGRGESPPKGSWLSRAHSRKLPEQTELYAQLRRTGQSVGEESESSARWAFGDHDYCMQGQDDSHKRPSSVVSPADEGEERAWGRLFSKVPEYLRGQESRGEGRRKPSPRSGSPQALSPHNAEEVGDRSTRAPGLSHHAPGSSCCQPHSPSSKQGFSCENSETCYGDKQRNKTLDDCQVFYIHNLPHGITQAMLRRRFGALGEPEECKIIMKNQERCGVITFCQAPSVPGQRRRREPLLETGGSGLRRFCRKRYIDLDEAGPGPVRSKYDALDFDTLLKEAQKSLHR